MGFPCADSQSAECSLQYLSLLFALSGTYSSLDKRGFRKCLSCGVTSCDLKSKLSENSRELGISVKLMLGAVLVPAVRPWSGDKRRRPLRAWGSLAGRSSSTFLALTLLGAGGRCSTSFISSGFCFHILFFFVPFSVFLLPLFWR